MKVLSLPEFIQTVGDTDAAKLFEVKPRTTKSWRLRDRYPSRKQAQVIAERSPVTFEGIFKDKT